MTNKCRLKTVANNLLTGCPQILKAMALLLFAMGPFGRCVSAEAQISAVYDNVNVFGKAVEYAMLLTGMCRP